MPSNSSRRRGSGGLYDSEAVVATTLTRQPAFASISQVVLSEIAAPLAVSIGDCEMSNSKLRSCIPGLPRNYKWSALSASSSLSGKRKWGKSVAIPGKAGCVYERLSRKFVYSKEKSQRFNAKYATRTTARTRSAARMIIIGKLDDTALFGGGAAGG